MKLMPFIMKNKLLTAIIVIILILLAYSTYVQIGTTGYTSMAKLDSLTEDEVIDGQIIKVRGVVTDLEWGDNSEVLDGGASEYFVYLDNSDRYFKLYSQGSIQTNIVAKLGDTLEVEVQAEKDFVLWFSVVGWKVIN